MKKMIVTLVAVVMVLAISVPVFAAGHEPIKHPKVPPQSIGKISENAAHGMHTAWSNVMYAEGVAAHVFANRFSPHN